MVKGLLTVYWVECTTKAPPVFQLKVPPGKTAGLVRISKNPPSFKSMVLLLVIIPPGSTRKVPLICSVLLLTKVPPKAIKLLLTGMVRGVLRVKVRSAYKDTFPEIQLTVPPGNTASMPKMKPPPMLMVPVFVMELPVRM